MVAGITTLFMIVFFTDLDFSRTTKEIHRQNLVHLEQLLVHSSNIWLSFIIIVSHMKRTMRKVLSTWLRPYFSNNSFSGISIHEVSGTDHAKNLKT